MRDSRGRAKREKEYYAGRDRPQACRVCGRWFTIRHDDVCSVTCKAKAEADQGAHTPYGYGV
jgi:hypothetical protein